MIKNIVFDIGNIILEGSPKNALKYIDIDETAKQIIENVVFNNGLWVNLDLGFDDFDSYFEKIRVDLPIDLHQISKSILKTSHEYRKFNQEIIKLIKVLSKKYKIYILSDNNLETINYLKNTEISKYINSWCVSYRYHEVKKDKKLFQIFFETNNLDPTECYFIDDKKENVEIGNYFGMNGFALDWKNNTFDDLINELYNNELL